MFFDIISCVYCWYVRSCNQRPFCITNGYRCSWFIFTGSNQTRTPLQRGTYFIPLASLLFKSTLQRKTRHKTWFSGRCRMLFSPFFDRRVVKTSQSHYAILVQRYDALWLRSFGRIKAEQLGLAGSQPVRHESRPPTPLFILVSTCEI